jgi:hypothetical protein
MNLLIDYFGGNGWLFFDLIIFILLPTLFLFFLKWFLRFYRIIALITLVVLLLGFYFNRNELLTTVIWHIGWALFIVITIFFNAKVVRSKEPK